MKTKKKNVKWFLSLDNLSATYTLTGLRTIKKIFIFFISLVIHINIELNELAEHYNNSYVISFSHK